MRQAAPCLDSGETEAAAAAGAETQMAADILVALPQMRPDTSGVLHANTLQRAARPAPTLRDAQEACLWLYQERRLYTLLHTTLRWLGCSRAGFLTPDPQPAGRSGRKRQRSGGSAQPAHRPAAAGGPSAAPKQASFTGGGALPRTAQRAAPDLRTPGATKRPPSARTASRLARQTAGEPMIAGGTEAAPSMPGLQRAQAATARAASADSLAVQAVEAAEGGGSRAAPLAAVPGQGPVIVDLTEHQAEERPIAQPGGPEALAGRRSGAVEAPAAVRNPLQMLHSAAARERDRQTAASACVLVPDSMEEENQQKKQQLQPQQRHPLASCNRQLPSAGHQRPAAAAKGEALAAGEEPVQATACTVSQENAADQSQAAGPTSGYIALSSGGPPSIWYPLESGHLCHSCIACQPSTG